MKGGDFRGADVHPHTTILNLRLLDIVVLVEFGRLCLCTLQAYNCFKRTPTSRFIAVANVWQALVAAQHVALLGLVRGDEVRKACEGPHAAIPTRM